LYSNFRYLFLAPAFLFTLAAGYRLGKFNVDTRQTKSFIGLPSPSAALFVISLPLILEYSSSNALSSIILNPWTLYGTTITGGLLMIAEWPLMGIKFQHVKWQGNEYKYILIAGSVIALIFLRFAGIPVAILFYLILSIIQNVQQK
jgi:CDP-diacylglycerol--serine O-phosphatidyltransferase